MRLTHSRLALAVVAFFCADLYAFGQVLINPASRSFGKEGGGGSILTSGTGSWTASTAASWISITPRTSGTAGESCIYVVGANLSADSRRAVINIAGQTHTINQTGYSATLTPTSTTVTYEGGGGQISIMTDAGVAWTAVANADWASVTPPSGISASTVTYTVAPYGGVVTRTTSLTVAGKTFSITQTGTDVNISPHEVELDYGSDILQVQVAALGSTSWTVVPAASWISVVDDGSGAGDSTVTLAVGTNPSYLYRSGTVQIGSATFTITQQGTPYPVLDIVPPTASADPVGAYGNVAVLATPDAPWTAQSLDPWLIISDGSSGAGNGNIQYVVSSNPNLTERTGRIRVYPPVYQARSDLSLLLSAHVTGTNTDVSGWGRDLSGTLTRRFDGTQPWTLTGQPFYRTDDAFTLAFWFNIGSPNTVNRLVGVERSSTTHSAIYADALNRLVVQCAGESLVTSLSVASNVQYQVVVTTDAARNTTVYAGRRGDSIAQVGSKTFALAPFPSNYVLPERIRVGATELPNPGNLTDATIDDFRVYVRALSAYEAEQLFLNAGTSTPYGSFSQMGDDANVRVEYNLQGQCLVAGGIQPPADYAPAFSQFHVSGWFYYTSPTLIYDLPLGGQQVSRVRGTATVTHVAGGMTSPSWRYTFEYTDGTSASTPQHDGAQTVSDVNPQPSKCVEKIKIYGWATTYPSYGPESVSISSSIEFSDAGRTMYSWSPDANRFSLPIRSLDGDSKSRLGFRNHQSSFSSSSATYNLWMRLDSLPASGTKSILLRKFEGITDPTFSMAVLPAGRLRFTLNSVNHDYDAGLQPGRWHMLTIASQFGGSMKFYVDGAEVGNTPDFGAYPFGRDSNGSHSLIIGGWDGAIDYVGFYDGQLPSPQIKAIYDAEKPREVYHLVTQGVVTPALTPQAMSAPPAGGTVSTVLTLAQNVNWTATANAAWLQVTSPTSGAGSTTVNVLAAANPSVYQRQGTVTIASKAFTVNQAGLASSVSCDDTIFGTDGGGAWGDVSTEGNGQWQAVSQVPWLTVVIGQSGSGVGSVFIVCDPYTQTSSSRIGAVIIAGHTVYFTQRGFELSVTPQVAQVGSNAGAGEFGVAAPIGAIWEAIATHPWITIVGGTSGQGNGTVRYGVAANTTGATRTGRIIVSGREYTITQLASLLLTITTDGSGTVSGGGSYATLATATLGATPGAGYVFSHWTGDAVGSANPLSLSMDSSKTVTAHFIQQELADTIALNSKERLGLYTTDQMHSLALGYPVLEVNPANGKMSLFMGVLERQSLTAGDWSDVLIKSADVFIEGGRVRVDITPAGAAAFYRVSGGTGE
jgi:hypothetical protein